MGSYPTYQVTLVWDRPILGIFVHCKLGYAMFQIQILCQTVIYLYIRYSLDIYMLSREIPIIILILIKTNVMYVSGSFTSLHLFWQTLCSLAPSCVQYISSAGRPRPDNTSTCYALTGKAPLKKMAPLGWSFAGQRMAYNSAFSYVYSKKQIV